MADTALGTGTERETLINDAFAEGESDAALLALADKEDVTATDLREALGADAEGLTDEQLTQQWQEAQNASDKDDDSTVDGDDKEVGDEKAEALKLEGYKLYDAEGKEIADPSKVAVADLLTGKVQIGYQAMSKEQRKSMKDLARMASLGHYNEHKYTTTVAERQQAAKRAQEAEAKVGQYEKDRRAFDQALTALINGNADPIRRLAESFQKALGEMPVDTVPASAQDAEWDRAGQQFITDTVVPRAGELASLYGANATEITNVMLHMFTQEGEFLTREKIDNIMQQEIPALLEQNGYVAGAAPKPDARDAEMAELKKQVAALTAAQNNSSVAATRDKAKKAPSGGGKSGVGGNATKRVNNDEDMPDFKNARAMKAWLRGDDE